MATPHTEKTALITGANSGVGLELTKRLLAEGWQVIALIRSEFSRSEAQIEMAYRQGTLRSYVTDLSDYTSLRASLDEILSCEQQVDVVFNNAAAAVGGITLSRQGREMHFDVNTVVPYIIAMHLKPLLMRSHMRTIVNTSSNALLMLRRFDLALLEQPASYRPIIGPYGASKLALSLWSQHLAPSLQAEGIRIVSVNPGANKTKMTNSKHFPLWMRPIRELFFTHPSVGAERLYDAATGAWSGNNGAFLNNGKSARLPFLEQAPLVQARLQQIYQDEFLGQSIAVAA